MLQPSPYRLLGWDVSLPRGVECPACSQVNQPAGNIYPCKNSNSTPIHSTTILMLGMSKPLTSATIQIFPTFSSLSKPTRREFPSFFFLAYTATVCCVQLYYLPKLSSIAKPNLPISTRQHFRAGVFACMYDKLALITRLTWNTRGVIIDNDNIRQENTALWKIW